jgi:S1-C subfamily serine protease
MTRFMLFFSFLILVIFPGCSKNKLASTHGEAGIGKYASEFPTKNASDEIEKVTHSVKKVYSVSSYTTYQFRRESKITVYHLRQGTYKKFAWGVISTNETVFGTATILGYDKSKVALLTCAHVVDSPDTLISYFESEEEDPVQYIHSLSVKEKQDNWVKELSSCGSFTILATDKQNDIAILGKNCESLSDTVIPFPYPPGLAGGMGWGTFVYVFGYPMGNQVITKGIVSPSAKRPMGEFSIDALLNKGYSGGIILALRNGVPGFELVGMVKTVSSNREEFLKPSANLPRTPDWLPYQGEVYIGKNDQIQYGLNTVVPFESILSFYMKNRPGLVSNGYNLDPFFLPPKSK